MTVTEYRKQNPNCDYCKNRVPPFEICIATAKRMSKRRAKRCPCYVAEEWKY